MCQNRPKLICSPILPDFVSFLQHLPNVIASYVLQIYFWTLMYICVITCTHCQEGILREHPAILDAVVIGIPDRQCGERPKAFVMRRPNSNVTEQDIQEFIAKQVIKYKRLTGGVQFIDSIPKTPTGKVLRREIRKLYV